MKMSDDGFRDLREVAGHGRVPSQKGERAWIVNKQHDPLALFHSGKCLANAGPQPVRHLIPCGSLLREDFRSIDGKGHWS